MREADCCSHFVQIWTVLPTHLCRPPPHRNVHAASPSPLLPWYLFIRLLSRLNNGSWMTQQRACFIVFCRKSRVEPDWHFGAIDRFSRKPAENLCCLMSNYISLLGLCCWTVSVETYLSIKLTWLLLRPIFHHISAILYFIATRATADSAPRASVITLFYNSHNSNHIFLYTYNTISLLDLQTLLNLAAFFLQHGTDNQI